MKNNYKISYMMWMFLGDIAQEILQTNWYLHDFDAGFELMVGGAGLTAESFSFAVNTGVSTTTTSINTTTSSQTTPAPGVGDVNNSGSIDIVDALLIAQYYVGLNPSNFNQAAADTNCNGTIDIVDALLIAQYYVGLISGLC